MLFNLTRYSLFCLMLPMTEIILNTLVSGISNMQKSLKVFCGEKDFSFITREFQISDYQWGSNLLRVCFLESRSVCVTSQVSPNNLFNQICSDELLLATLGLGFKASQETHSYTQFLILSFPCCSPKFFVLGAEPKCKRRAEESDAVTLRSCSWFPLSRLYNSVYSHQYLPTGIKGKLNKQPTHQSARWSSMFLVASAVSLRVTLLLIQIDPIVETSSVQKRLCISLVVHSGYQEVVGIYNVWDVFMSRNAYFFFLNQRHHRLIYNFISLIEIHGVL